MSKQRIYKVDITIAPTSVRLVRAQNASQAVRHVAEGMITAEVASQESLVRLIGQGMKVEDAGEEVAEPTKLQEAAE